MARDGSPPRWLERATFVALAALLYFPLHVRYQNPDQDYPALALIEFVRGGWEPSTLQYPSALTNLLHAAYAIGLAGARLVGWHVTADDLLAAWSRDPAPFRILPRFLAIQRAERAGAHGRLRHRRRYLPRVAEAGEPRRPASLGATQTGFARSFSL